MDLRQNSIVHIRPLVRRFRPEILSFLAHDPFDEGLLDERGDLYSKPKAEWISRFARSNNLSKRRMCAIDSSPSSL